MKLNLSKIQEPIKEELKHFEDYFKQSMKSKVPLLDKITYYIVQRKGKQVRPMFVFLAAKMFGSTSKHTYTAASFIELLHTATLVHDDVVDDAHMRRSFFSINALWKNKIAVLVGDFLLSRGLLLACESDQFELLKIMAQAVKDMSEGELLQIEKARKLDIKEEIYFEIIRQKTASLIASACASGSYSVTNSLETAEMMRKFGEKIGIAFQIKDDLFDYGSHDIGKPKGIDIKEKKMTLPLIHVLSKANRSDKKWIINTVKKHNEDKKRVDELIQYVRNHGGLDYAIKMMNTFKDEALAMLVNVPESPAKLAMIDLVNFVVDRRK